MTLHIWIAKFKFRQHQLRVVSPNLMLAKVICYMVYFPMSLMIQKVQHYYMYYDYLSMWSPEIEK